jgi:hypothetical protein
LLRLQKQLTSYKLLIIDELGPDFPYGRHCAGANRRDLL